MTIAAAVEAVETAVMFPCGEIPPPVNKILESIGYSRWRPANCLLEIRERALAMMNVTKMEAVKGTQKLHSVDSLSKERDASDPNLRKL